jgi:hypothetical protein
VTGDGPQHPPLPGVAHTPGGRPHPGARPDSTLDPTPVRFAQPAGDGWFEWVVFEADAAAVPGAHGARCLVFAREDCIRRVWDYPADWRTLDAEALAALSWHR